MNLFTKHLIALDTPHFYEKMIQEKFLNYLIMKVMEVIVYGT